MKYVFGFSTVWNGLDQSYSFNWVGLVWCLVKRLRISFIFYLVACMWMSVEVIVFTPAHLVPLPSLLPSTSSIPSSSHWRWPPAPSRCAGLCMSAWPARRSPALYKGWSPIALAQWRHISVILLATKVSCRYYCDYTWLLEQSYWA